MTEPQVGNTPPPVEPSLFDPPAATTHHPRKRHPDAARVTADQVETVMATWRHVCDHPRAKLSPARDRRIREAIRVYGIDTTLDAVHGITHSDWHMGKNPAGQRYDDITLILRDARNIEKFAALRPRKRFLDDEG
jgi:hypothetical protein